MNENTAENAESNESEDGEEVDELAVEMMEVDGPVSWTEFFCKIVLFLQILFFALLVAIYFF